MHGKTRNTLLGYGLATDLIDLIDKNGDNVSTLQVMPVAELNKRYGEQQAGIIADRLKRKPIEQETIEELVRLSGGCCCYCADGNAARPYQIHHVELYSKSQNHSLGNLSLVCPTHHVGIHAKNVPEEEQLRTRDSWYAIRSVAAAYEKAGLSFPFGVFESVSYIGNPSPESLFLAPTIAPSTAVALTRHKIADQVEHLLLTQRFAVVAGVSGSGKTTCAIGTAGRPSFEGSSVYLHRGRSDNPIQARSEVLAFLQLVTEPCILILDNANLWAHGDVLDELSQAASQTAAVVVSWTDSESSRDKEVLSAHVFGLRVTLTWNAIYESILTILMAHEAAVVDALNPTLARAKEHTLHIGGVGPFLSERMADFAAKVKTVWEFVFLMRAGWSEVEQDLAQFVEDSRADVPIVYAAIEQIADIERPVSPQEAAEASAALGPLQGLPPATADWVRIVFEGAKSARRMVRARGSYSTIHRQWARALINSALGSAPTAESTRRLLARDFNVGTTKPRRTLILISWLARARHGKQFLWDWSLKLTVDDVSTLFASCAKASLADIAFACESLQFRRSDRERSILAAAIDANEGNIIQAVQSATPTDWSVLKRLAHALKALRPACAERLLSSWKPERVAEVLLGAEPEFLDAADWFFGAASELAPEWCREVGRHLDSRVISKRALLAKPGNVHPVADVIKILNRLGAPIYRSALRTLAQALGQLIAKASLDDLYFPWAMPDLMLLELFPDDVRTALATVDPIALARAYEISLPRYWQRLNDLSKFAIGCGSDLPHHFANAIDSDKIAATALRFAAGHPHETAQILYQLADASEPKRAEFAEKLLPAAEVAYAASEAYREQVLVGFYTLDRKKFPSLCERLGIPVPQVKPLDEIMSYSRRLLHPGYKRVEQRITELEAGGQDYDVGVVLRVET